MRIYNQNLREFMAEGLGTFTLVALGCAANANSKLTGGPLGVAALSWGLALTAGIYIAGNISGGHLNPGVTLGLASVGKIPLYKVPHYLAAQFIGAFFGALLVFLVYSNALFSKFGDVLMVSGENGSADIFGTYPANDSTILVAFFEQLIGCAFFLLLINAITDKKNMNCPKGLIPIAIGLTDLSLMILTYSYSSGSPINAARDFSPRLLSSMVGYGGEVFTANSCYFWVPLIATPLGSIIGSLTYKFLIENHHPSELETADQSSKEPVKFQYKINRIPSFQINKY